MSAELYCCKQEKRTTLHTTQKCLSPAHLFALVHTWRRVARWWKIHDEIFHIKFTISCISGCTESVVQYLCCLEACVGLWRAWTNSTRQSERAQRSWLCCSYVANPLVTSMCWLNRCYRKYSFEKSKIEPAQTCRYIWTHMYGYSAYMQVIQKRIYPRNCSNVSKWSKDPARLIESHLFSQYCVLVYNYQWH